MRMIPYGGDIEKCVAMYVRRLSEFEFQLFFFIYGVRWGESSIKEECDG